MAVDYDLVILGGTPEGYAAAEEAAQIGARVALVLAGQDGWRSPLQTLGLLQIGSAHPLVSSDAFSYSSWRWVRERAKLIANHLADDATQQLMVQGIDVIAEPGRLGRDRARDLKVVTASRELSTRTVLLATGSIIHVPNIPGLATVPYESIAAFLQREQLPASVVILGSSPTGLALCQLLRNWRLPVTLVTTEPTLLNHEDPDISRWLIAQLQAIGVRLKLGKFVKSIASDAENIRLQLSAETLSAASLVLATPAQPNLANLDLNHWLLSDRPVVVNAFGQTQHSRIFACGAVLGGYDLPAIAQQEARGAVWNALFWNHRRLNYQIIPYDLPTQPAIARVGLTEIQARQRYGAAALLVARQPLYDNPEAQWRESVTGFCKLIAHRNGQLLGGHGVGPEAQAWIQALALLMAQRTPWWQLSQAATLSHRLTDILRQAAQQWQRDRWRPGTRRRDWAENWHNWRRSR